MGSSRAGLVAVARVALVAGQVGCAVVQRPGPLPPLAPDRYQHAADPDPAVRSRAADELVADPAQQGIDFLLVLEQRDVDPAVRAHAAEAIAERRDPRRRRGSSARSTW